ncbi:MAG TPA: hypothetical protein VJA40_04375, partial [archaeon]|nr:hypothetical protein [archaeon]
DGETVVFHRGNSYVLETRESVNLPNDMTARIQPRMSTCLLGLSLSTADVDAGYKGGLRFSAYCVSPCEIEIGTRFCQVIFNRLEEPTEKPYQGFYQNLSSLDAGELKKREQSMKFK